MDRRRRGCATTPRLSWGKFVQRARRAFSKEEFAKYNLEFADYVDGDTPVQIVCEDHGPFRVQAKKFLREGKGCPECKKEKTRSRYSLSTQEFISKARDVWGDAYGYHYCRYRGHKEKIKIMCPGHGMFFLLPTEHVEARQGCPACSEEDRRRALDHPVHLPDATPKTTWSTKKKTTEDFIAAAQSVHGDRYDYQWTYYSNARTKLLVVCRVPSHGPFHVRPNHHLSSRSGCPKCAKECKATGGRTSRSDISADPFPG